MARSGSSAWISKRMGRGIGGISGFGFGRVIAKAGSVSEICPGSVGVQEREWMADGNLLVRFRRRRVLLVKPR